MPDPTNAAAKPDKDAKLVLIVEDDKVVRELLATSFEEAGFRARTAKDGIAAIGDIPVFKPDVILLDMMLPGPSGLDILEQIQSTGFADTPVVVYTAAYRGPALKKLEQQFPCVKECVEKPADLRVVLEAVIRALATRA
ncbi:MAG: response regulator [Elusimicrobiota bacterium]